VLHWPPGVPVLPLVASQVFVLVLAAQRAMQVQPTALMSWTLLLAVVMAQHLDGQTERTHPYPRLGTLGAALVVQQVA
jgi:hypothetical protein